MTSLSPGRRHPSMLRQAWLRPLFDAIRRGATESVRDLLQDGAPIEGRLSLKRYGYGVQALHVWAGVKQTPSNAQALLDVLLEAGAGLQDTDRSLRTPLHVAADRGRLTNVGLLLQAGANPHAVDHHGHTPLMLALLNGRPTHLAVAERLHAAGAALYPDVPDVERLSARLLHHAVAHLHAGTVRFLMAHDPHFSLYSASGEHILTAFAHIWLVFSGLDRRGMNRQGVTIDSQAALQTLDALMDAGMSLHENIPVLIEVDDKNTWRSVSSDLLEKGPFVLPYLVQHTTLPLDVLHEMYRRDRATGPAWSDDKAHLWVDALAALVERGDLEALQALHAWGAPLNQRDRSAETVLHRIALTSAPTVSRPRFWACVDFLLTHAGLDVNAVSNQHATALISVLGRRRGPSRDALCLPLVRRLLDHGADPNVGSIHRQPCSALVWIAPLCFKPSYLSPSFQAPYTYTLEERRTLVQWLLEAGASPLSSMDPDQFAFFWLNDAETETVWWRHLNALAATAPTLTQDIARAIQHNLQSSSTETSIALLNTCCRAADACPFFEEALQPVVDMRLDPRVKIPLESDLRRLEQWLLHQDVARRTRGGPPPAPAPRARL